MTPPTYKYLLMTWEAFRAMNDLPECKDRGNAGVNHGAGESVYVPIAEERFAIIEEALGCQEIPYQEVTAQQFEERLSAGGPRVESSY